MFYDGNPYPYLNQEEEKSAFYSDDMLKGKTQLQELLHLLYSLKSFI